MAITSSAKKAIRSSARKAVFNARHKKSVSRAIKDIEKLVASGKTDEARALLPKAYKEIDKAAKTDLLKDNTASRMKSRLSAFIKRASLKK
jgi:small subunit ribosomal protein S20